MSAHRKQKQESADGRRFSEQVVAMVSPGVDDRVRSLAVKHGVSVAHALRVALQVSLRDAEALDSSAYLRVHAVLESDARRRHQDCSGGWHKEDH